MRASAPPAVTGEEWSQPLPPAAGKKRRAGRMRSPHPEAVRGWSANSTRPSARRRAAMRASDSAVCASEGAGPGSAAAAAIASAAASNAIAPIFMRPRTLA